MCLDGAEEAVEEFWRSGTPLPARMAWYAIHESRMQKEGILNCFRTARYSQYTKKAARAQTFSKMIFGGWLELIEDPHRHWQFGFFLGHLGACCKGRVCPSEQQWDIVKAFDMLDREQLFRDVTAPNALLRYRRSTGPLSAGSHAHPEGRLLDSNGCASGRQLGSRSLPAKLRCCYSSVERVVGCATVGSSSCGTKNPNGAARGFDRPLCEPLCG